MRFSPDGGRCGEGRALGEKFVDEGVVIAGPLGEPAARIICFAALSGLRPQRRLPLGLGFHAGRRPVAQAGAVGGHGFLNRVGQVPPGREPVSDLDRLGRGSVGRISVGAGAVAADDLDAGMASEPQGRRGSVAISGSGSRTC
jgi:hypothetical protein